MNRFGYSIESSDYDRQCASEFSMLRTRVDRYFVELNTSCPYGKDYRACFYQALFGPLTDRVMELFLAAGYRRNGNCLYTMHCRQCNACVPIRMNPHSFRPNRNQKRTLKRNRDLALSFEPVRVDDEHLELCDRFLSARYPQEQNSGDSYYGGFFCNTIVNSMCIDYRLDGRLVGSSIVDLGQNWLNAVYFYFDPEEKKRSLGTFNIMTLVNTCLEMGMDFLYLGYFIEGVRAMSYKKNFHPHQLFLDSQWRTIE